MSDTSLSTMLLYSIITVGLRINSKIRKDINKYFMQDILNIPRIVSNRYTNLNDALSAFERIVISLYADFAWGIFYTIIILFPIYFLTFVTNIFSSVYFTSEMLINSYIITYSLGSMINLSIFTVIMSFMKDQFSKVGIFDQFFNSWYIIFNIFGSLSGFLASLTFKNIVVKNQVTKNIFLFLTLPLIISGLFFLIFLAYRKRYVIKKAEVKSFVSYVIGFFTKIPGFTDLQNNYRLATHQICFDPCGHINNVGYNYRPIQYCGN